MTVKTAPETGSVTMVSGADRAALYGELLRIRRTEETLLDLFSQGRLFGTTHTSIGQEAIAVATMRAIERDRDVVFSAHRCHGHFLAYGGPLDGLIAEIMGRATGICGGVGGSQHLCWRNFATSGIQGAISPISVGAALAERKKGSDAISVVFLGDGTLGEGVLYEALNMASLWQAPTLFVVEDNGYAQSTPRNLGVAGEIAARARAFGIDAGEIESNDVEILLPLMQQRVAAVRGRGRPFFQVVRTYRLAAHSKGDDDRDAAEIEAWRTRDPVVIARARIDAATAAAIEAEVEAEVAAAVSAAEAAAWPEPFDRPAAAAPAVADRSLFAQPDPLTGSVTVARELNAALGYLLENDPRVVVVGEDILDPYGGAFKVTRGLSDTYPDRVINTPISEAGIVGVGNGLALGGRRPVVEIMFGDFLGLCFDQLLNHAAKFHGMYNGRVTNAVVVRTPMGGGRGYGPTHSQNIEKHFAGIPGLRLLVLHGRTRVRSLYAELAASDEPTLIIENKLLYREACDAPLPEGYTRSETAGRYPATVLQPSEPADLTILAFGRMSVLAERVAAEIARDEEVSAELVFPLSASPFDVEPVLESIAATGKLLVVEEGAAHFDLAIEVLAAVAVAYRGARPLRVRRVGALPMPIPSSPDLEQQVLPGAERLRAACLELFDE